MADSFKIGNVLPRLFNGSKYETTTSRPSNQATVGKTYNPFATSGMKVDVLTADVFDTTTNFTGNIKTPSVSKIKRMASAFVGSINDTISSFRQGIESIGAFCGRIKNDVKNGITNTWHFLNETKVPSIMDITRSIKSQWEAKQYAKEVNMYAAKPVDTLRSELVDSLSMAA